jgi:iron(II)-dependent oxidoreductase
MRNGTDPNTKMNWLGFRCARDAQEPASTQLSLALPKGSETAAPDQNSVR